MVNLMELTEDEVNEYIESAVGQTQQEKDDILLSQLLKKLDNTLKAVDRTSQKIKFINELLISRDSSKLQNAGKECVESINALHTGVNNLSVVLTNIGYKKDAFVEISEKENVYFENLPDNVFHIVFDSLLPKKPKTIENNMLNQYKIVRARYLNAFTEYFKDKRYAVYDKKAVICFIHHFSTEHNVRDHDNFEIKFIIDALATYLLVDDSSKYCSHYMDYVLDKKDYTEIFVVPISHFAIFANNKKWF